MSIALQRQSPGGGEWLATHALPNEGHGFLDANAKTYLQSRNILKYFVFHDHDVGGRARMWCIGDPTRPMAILIRETVPRECGGQKCVALSSGNAGQHCCAPLSQKVGIPTKPDSLRSSPM